MDRDSARQEIRRSWRNIMQEISEPARQNVNGEKSYICPLCRNGEGGDGDGLTFNPKSKDGHGLKCFKCSFSGDIIDLYQQYKTVDYNTALSSLAQILGITIDSHFPYHTSSTCCTGGTQSDFRAADNKSSTADKNVTADAAEVREQPADYIGYYNACRQRLNDPVVIEYLKRRGISMETAEKYFLGYDPAWISPTAKSNGKNPPESPRLIIPTSRSHYIARDIRQQLMDNQKRYAKMNEGSPCIFNERALYLQDEREIFVTEGAIDALSVIEIGATAIALNSTSNVDTLLKKLEQKRTGATLILCLDSDSAGRKASSELRAGLQRLNISNITADINGGYGDPNEALTANREAFCEAVREAKRQAGSKPDNVEYYIDSLMGSDIKKFKNSIKTGYSNLDEYADGLYTGLYVIAAISSLGKTTFAHQLADQIAAGGNDVLFFSLEQSRLEMVSKSLARLTAKKNPDNAVTSLSIRKGYLPKAVQEAAIEYKATVQDRLSIIEGNFNCDISFIGNYIRQYIRRNSSDGNDIHPVVFIDYLQILQPTETDMGRRQNTKEAVDSAVTELKRLSRELDITIFVISSINRANYLTPIDFESLKESGGIEYTADVIWGLQLQCLHDPVFDNDKKIKEKRRIVKEAKGAILRKIELVCLKNRYGIPSYSCFFDYSPAVDLFEAGIPDYDVLDESIEQGARGHSKVKRI